MPPRKPAHPYGLGSVYQRQDGRWVAAGAIPQPDGTRRRQTFYGPTAAAAQARLAAARAQADSGLPTRGGRQPLGAFLRWWLEHVQRPRVAPATYELTERLIRQHLAPALGTVPLAALTAQQVAAFYAHKRRQGYAPASIGQMHATLRTALAAAERWGLVARNVATLARADLPRAAPAPVAVLDVEPARRFLAAARGHRLEALCIVALYCGLRRGELAGLRWQDVDLDGARLHVRRKAIRIGRRILEDAPKGGKARTLDLAPPVVAALRAHRARQAAERIAAPEWARPDLVFVTRLGALLNPTGINTNVVRPLIRRAGLGGLTAHGLRHSFASLALAGGADAAAVAADLGHASAVTTLRTYRHVLPSERGRVARRVADLLADEPAGDEAPG